MNNGGGGGVVARNLTFTTLIRFNQAHTARAARIDYVIASFSLNSFENYFLPKRQALTSRVEATTKLVTTVDFMACFGNR